MGAASLNGRSASAQMIDNTQASNPANAGINQSLTDRWGPDEGASRLRSRLSTRNAREHQLPGRRLTATTEAPET
jgi:hypothetical protein